MRATAIFSCSLQTPTQAQRDAIAARGIEWVVLSRRPSIGRVMIDANADRNDLLWLGERLTAANMDPMVIAAFRFDTGQRIKGVPINATEYLRCMPDDIDPVTGALSRPTVVRQIHQWAGWAWHSPQEEP